MKYPEINIATSYILQENILMSNYNIKKIEGFKKKVAGFLLKKNEFIYENLSKMTGLDLVRSEIIIWLFEGKHRSIPDPFLLNVYDYDLEFCILEFVHMMVHIIFQDNSLYEIFEKNGRIDETELEAVTYLITKRIMQKLFPEKTIRRLLILSEESGFRKYIWDRVEELEQETSSEDEIRFLLGQ